MASQKITINYSYFLWSIYKICTDKLPVAATVHFPGAKWFVHACHYSQRLDL